MIPQSPYYSFLSILTKYILANSSFDPRDVCRNIADFINKLPVNVEWMQELNEFIEKHGDICRDRYPDFDWAGVVRLELQHLGYYDKLVSKTVVKQKQNGAGEHA